MTPGVEMNSGSLGMGLSFALGHALAARLDGKDYRVFALLGDGECQEGEIWEAAMAAAHHKARNLTAIVDRNRIQNDRFTDEVMALEPLADRWRDFGWAVFTCDGHQHADVLRVLDESNGVGPAVIIAETVKGKGVSFMENNPRIPRPGPYRRRIRCSNEGVGLMATPRATAATRETYGRTLLTMAEDYPDIVVLGGDLNVSTFVHLWRDQYPDRFFDFGPAEQNIVGVAAGPGSRRQNTIRQHIQRVWHRSALRSVARPDCPAFSQC